MNLKFRKGAKTQREFRKTNKIETGVVGCTPEAQLRLFPLRLCAFLETSRLRCMVQVANQGFWLVLGDERGGALDIFVRRLVGPVQHKRLLW